MAMEQHPEYSPIHLEAIYDVYDVACHAHMMAMFKDEHDDIRYYLLMAHTHYLDVLRLVRATREVTPLAHCQDLDTLLSEIQAASWEVETLLNAGFF